MRTQQIVIIGFLMLLTITALAVSAQEAAPTLPADVSGAACAPALESLWTTASNACVGGPEGFICNGGGAPAAEPAGQIANALAPVGSLVETNLVHALHTPPNSPETGAIGALWLRLAAPLRVTALVLGSVTLWDVSPPDFPAWQSMLVRTVPDPSSCLSAPQNSLILQSALDVPARIAVNGVSINLNGTVLVRTNDLEMQLVGLSGTSNVIAFGQEQTLFTGQQINVPYANGDFTRPAAPPPAPIPYDLTLTRFLPTPLFDRPFLLPQPGTVATQGTVNLRTAPSTDAAIVAEVAPGQIASILGRSAGGDWYHVRVPGGATGWMRADLLLVNVGTIEAVYDATPSLPQRFGDLGRVGQILSPAGVNLRIGPDPTFSALASLNAGTTVTLLARSPYSPWVKVDAGGVVGWVSLLAIDTRAFLEALPVDFSAPPPPTPTRIPGSFGNAFPDPNNPGN